MGFETILTEAERASGRDFARRSQTNDQRSGFRAALTVLPASTLDGFLDLVYGDAGRLEDRDAAARRIGKPGAIQRARVGHDVEAGSIAASIDRARDVLGYQPRYTSLDALHGSVRWLAANGLVDLDLN